jgi:ribonuclease-3
LTVHVEEFARHLHARGLLPAASFRRPSLVMEALTHSSYAAENATRHNERLEMLGDAILGFVVADLVFDLAPDAPEGVLTRLRASVVDESSRATRARTIGLGPFLLLGHGEERSGGRDRGSLLADAFEALLAAVYLSEGLDAARLLVARLFRDEALQRLTDGVQTTDFKSALQVRAQGQWRTTPAYRIAGVEGLEHERLFRAEVLLSGRVLGSGAGRTKKEAEQRAAQEALHRLSSPNLDASVPLQGPK